MSLIDSVQSSRPRSMLARAFFMHGGKSPRPFYLHVSKRLIDIILALVLVAPVGMVIAVFWGLTRLQGGPGFFGHSRVGQSGKSFKCWKIRTMAVDSDARLAEYLAANPDAAREWALNQKLQNDPRVTKLGSLLRKTSLDELPQLWNVLIGDMSFVGPRPVVRSELERYGHHRTAYLAMKPGITGLWQVSGRNSVCYDARVKLDVSYFDGVSFSKDLWILLATLPVVLRRTGM